MSTNTDTGANLPKAPRIAKLRPGSAPLTLRVTWKAGGTDEVDFTGLIARHPALAALVDLDVFGTARPDDWGASVVWPGEIDIGAAQLKTLADYQRPMSGAALAELRAELGVSQQELSDMLGVARRTIQGHEAAEEVPIWLGLLARAFATDADLVAARFRPRRAGRPPKFTARAKLTGASGVNAEKATQRPAGVGRGDGKRKRRVELDDRSDEAEGRGR